MSEAFKPTGNQYGVGVGMPPGRPAVPSPAVDARTHAMRAFQRFLSTLRFFRAGNVGGDPTCFQVPEADIFIEMPDNVEDLRFPSLAFLPSRANYDSYGLGPAQMMEDTLDVYGPGTTLVQQAEYSETFAVEVWASKKAERRALLAGIETALMSFDDSWALRMRLPDYYDRTAVFALSQREVFDDPDVVRNRRRGHLYVELRVDVVRLVNANELRPYLFTTVDDDC